MMKKIIALLMVSVMMLSMAGCSVEKAEEQQPSEEAVVEQEGEAAAEATATEITLWTYPIGGWGTQETVDSLMAGFEEETELKLQLNT